MSLSVHVFLPGEDGTRTVLDPTGPGTHLAGFESFRTTVWGSAAIRALGARYFPVLAGADLTVLPEEIPDFQRECTLVEANVERIAPRENPHHPHEWFVSTISARLANIQTAADRALATGGGILIW